MYIALFMFVYQAFEAFKAQHGEKPFTLTQCWMIINGCPMFKDQYASLKINGGP